MKNWKKLLVLTAIPTACMRGAEGEYFPAKRFLDDQLASESAYACTSASFEAGTFDDPVDVSLGNHVVMYKNSPLPPRVAADRSEAGVFVHLKHSETQELVSSDDFRKPMTLYLALPQAESANAEIGVLVVSNPRDVTSAQRSLHKIDGKEFVVDPSGSDRRGVKVVTKRNDVIFIAYLADGEVTQSELEPGILQEPILDTSQPVSDDDDCLELGPDGIPTDG